MTDANLRYQNSRRSAKRVFVLYVAAYRPATRRDSRRQGRRPTLTPTDERVPRFYWATYGPAKEGLGYVPSLSEDQRHSRCQSGGQPSSCDVAAIGNGAAETAQGHRKGLGESSVTRTQETTTSELGLMIPIRRTRVRCHRYPRYRRLGGKLRTFRQREDRYSEAALPAVVRPADATNRLFRGRCYVGAPALIAPECVRTR